MPTIDQYSLAAIPIEFFFNQTFLGLGTAFVWHDGTQYFLITNWHNFSGRNPFTGKHILKTAAEPNALKVWWNTKGQMGNKFATTVPIRDGNGAPLWFVHPQHGIKVDVVALPVEANPQAEMYPINHMPHDALSILVGMDVFVLGYPFGIGPGGMPIWKRGSIASEPEIFPADHFHMLIDTASRPGMSGSPVIRRSWSTHIMDTGDINMGQRTATKCVGVYSGRIISEDPLDAQLGLTWPAHLVAEIVSGQQLDS